MRSTFTYANNPSHKVGYSTWSCCPIMSSYSFLIFAIILISASALSVLVIYFWRQMVSKGHHLSKKDVKSGVFVFGQFSPLLTWLKYHRLPEFEADESILPPIKKDQKSLPKARRFLSRLTAKINHWLEQPLLPLPIAAVDLIRVPHVSVLTGLILCALNTVILIDTSFEYKFIAWFFFALGVFSAGLGAISSIRVVDEKIQRGFVFLSDWLEISPSQVICLFASPAFALTAGLASAGEGGGLIIHHPTVAVLAWMISVLLVIIGGIASSPRAQRASRKHVVLVVLFVLVGFLVRVVLIDQAPIIGSGDEGASGLNAVDFLFGKANNVLGIAWRGFPAFYFWIQAIPIAFFGQTIAAARLSSAFAGALTIGAIYLTGRTMFSHRTGALAAILLVGFHVHFHFSRIGLNNIWDGLSYTLAIGSVWYAWKWENRSAFLLLGLMLGLSQYFYLTARLMLLFIIVWLLIVSMLNRQRAKRVLPDILLMGITAVIVTLPLVLAYLQQPGDFLHAIQQYSLIPGFMTKVNSPSSFILALATQLQRGFGAFVLTPLSTGWYSPGSPLLRTIPALLFTVGLIVLVMRSRDPRTYLLGLWLITFGIIGSLSDSTPAGQRYVGVLSACTLIAALGIEALATYLAEQKPAWASHLPRIAILLAILLSLDDLRFYFFDYIPESYYRGFHAFEDRKGAIARHLAQYLLYQESDQQVIFLTDGKMYFGSIPSIQYIAPQIQGIDVEKSWASLGSHQPISDHLIFVFLPARAGEIALVEQKYPGGVVQTEHGHFGETLYYLYQYPSQEKTTLPYRPAWAVSPFYKALWFVAIIVIFLILVGIKNGLQKQLISNRPMIN